MDDMSPEVHGYVVERLLAAGALDAYLTPVIMKKGRPGVVLSVLCRPGDAGTLARPLFAETTTLGIRTFEVLRHRLPREIKTVRRPMGRSASKWRAGKGARRPPGIRRFAAPQKHMGPPFAPLTRRPCRRISSDADASS